MKLTDQDFLEGFFYGVMITAVAAIFLRAIMAMITL